MAFLLVPDYNLEPSGAVTVSSNNQVIENLWIKASGIAINVGSYSGVTIRNCLIWHNMAGGTGDAQGIVTNGANNLTIEDTEIINYGAPLIGPNPSANKSNIRIVNGSNLTVTRVTTRGGSNGLHISGLNGSTINFFESHDLRGPFPRGMAIQWAGCTGTHLAQDLSDETIPGISNSEDSFSVYNTPNVTMRRIKVPMGTDGTAGRGVVYEQAQTTNCFLEDVELEWMYNGAALFGLGCNDVHFTDIRTKGWNRYSVRGWAGSSGKTPTGFPPLTYAADVTSETSPNGTFEGKYYARGYSDTDTWNLKTIGANVTETIVEENWTPTLSVIRNSFSWRPTDLVPSVLVHPRIGSYWLDGVVSNTPVAGTTVLSLLPGKYRHDPTSRTWQWKKNGTNISGATGISYVTVSGDANSLITCEETVTNSAGSSTYTTLSIRIP